MVCRLRDDWTDEPHTRRMACGAAGRNASMVHHGPTECDRGPMAGLASGQGNR